MKRFLISLAAILIASPAYAQVAQPVSGYDYTGHIFHPLNTDSSGRLQVVGSASGGTVYGPDAPGTTATQSPLRIAGCSSPLTNSCTVSNWLVDSTGTGVVRGGITNGGAVPTTGLLVGGSDGTSFRQFITANSGAQIIAGEGNNGSTTIVSRFVNVGGYDGVANRILHTDTNGNLTMVGSVASGATDSGNPVKVGGVFNSTLPTFTTGQRGDFQINNRGSLMVGTLPGQISGDGVSSTYGAGVDLINNARIQATVNYLYNGSTSDQQRSINSVSTGGVGVSATALAAYSVAQGTLTPVSSTVVESGHVLKAGAGNLYRIAVTTSVSGYLLVFNSTTVPADGSVTPQMCRAIPAGSTEVDHSTIPQRYSTGISVAFSTTGCFTKTASVSAMFEGDVM